MNRRELVDWRRWSLRRRLLVVLAALVAVGLVLADVATYHTLRSYLLNREDTQLDSLAQIAPRTLAIAERIGGRATFPAPGDLLSAAGPFQAFIQLRGPDGSVVETVQARRTDAAALAPPALPQRLADSPSSSVDAPAAVSYWTFASSASGEAAFRVRVSQLQLNESGGAGDGNTVFGGGGFGSGAVLGPPGQVDTLVVAQPLSDIAATLHKLFWTEFGVSAAAVALAVLGGWWLVRLGLRPLEAMSDTADEIAAGRLDRRVDVPTTSTEVGRLGGALNGMLGRIETAFTAKERSEDRLRRFVADASHELRTPLTSIRGYAELFRRGADRRPEDLAKAMTRIEQEATRMGVLVDDMLLLARIDQGRPLEREPVDFGVVVEEAVDAARAVDPDRPLAVDLADGVTILGDRNRLRQVVDNLLVNVRVHTPPAAPASVQLRTDGSEAVLEVRDTGAGLDPETASRVFERFYRVDPARSAQSGGAGLGLSIVEAIVVSHGGRVAARSLAPEPGTSFEVRLPLAGAERPAEWAEAQAEWAERPSEWADPDVPAEPYDPFDVAEPASTQTPNVGTGPPQL